jgi:group I intron endonuclease
MYCEVADNLPKVMEIEYLHLTETLKTAKGSLDGQSGIYAFKCLETGAHYIGSSVDLYDRFYAHIMGHYSNLHIQRAILKYGLASFVFLVVEFCAKDLLQVREQHYLDWLFALPAKLIYNFNPIAGIPPSFEGKKHTEEAKAKMSASLKGKPGRKHTEDTIAKMRQVKSGFNHPMYGKTHSQDAKDKIRVALSGMSSPMYGKTGGKHPKSIRVFIYSLENQLIQECESQTAAAKYLNTSSAQIHNYIKSGRVFKDKYVVRNTKLD